MIIAFIILGILIVSVLCILPPSTGKLEPFTNDEGEELENSVSEKTYLDVDGTELGMFLRGEDTSNPVMLFLGGGPGIPQYLLEDMYPSGIEKEFTVCYLEYRGTSLSYQSGMKKEDMTTERYIEDISAVTKYLQERFDQKQIYLMGHSFGTYLGLLTAEKYPENYIAYIAMSQQTNQEKSEKLAYEYMRNQYIESGNKKMQKEFDKYPIMDSMEAYDAYFQSSLRDHAMHELGVGTMHNMNSVITGIFFPSLRCKAYTPMERINIWRAKAFVAPSPVSIDRTKFDAFSQVKAIEIPIYFLGGEHDMTCCYSLQKDFYEQIEAPEKEFYSFENSAHSPLYEESDKAIEILKEIEEEQNNRRGTK